jgi:hypothetical protein
MPNSATTAAGYLAATTFQPRSVLPIVMSNVGGPAGWTTSVFLERGTATQATIRYYSAATGALAATQQLALVASGTRIDPRGVAGLSDNTAYSVTIDGNGGTLTAVALQQAFTGGDALMMYEGFGGPSLPVSAQPGSVRVSFPSDTIVVGASEQFSASVLDQFGVPLSGAQVTWSVAPASVGMISPTGLFATGGVGGSGTVTATTGTITTSAQINVEVPTPSTIGGIGFLATTTSSLDLYTEATISRADMQSIITQSVADVAQIQADYATGYAHRPAVYVLAGPTSFSTAVQAIGGASAPSSWAAGECACSGGSNMIFLDWADEAGLAEIRDLRHELTHAMAHDLANGAFLPAWFDEGNARVEEFSVPGTKWFEMLQRYRAASMAAQGSLYTLADLVSPSTWAARPDLAATYEYAVAAEAVGLLRADVGMSGEIAILRAVGQGVTFEQAYGTVADQPLDTFASRYGARIRALAPSYPGIATAPDAPSGSGVTFVVYGLPANATFSLSITGGNGFFGGGLRVADAYGVYYSYLTTGWPPGTYTISATWSGGSVSTSAVKTSSLDASASADGEPSSGP